MILQPTEQELKERGFKTIVCLGYYYIIINDIELQYYQSYIDGDTHWFVEDSIDIYPKSWDDIDTLIELLTPKE